MNRHQNAILFPSTLVGALDWGELGRRVREAAEVAAEFDVLHLADGTVAGVGDEFAFVESSES